MKRPHLLIFNLLFLVSCSIQKQIGKFAKTDVLDAKALQTAHVGLSIFEPASNKYWFNHQGDKYFVPASNIKIPTCYAAMKYLGDSIVGLKYIIEDTVLYLKPTGDPSFLLPEFTSQPVFNFLNNIRKKIHVVYPHETNFRKPFGSGWTIGDRSEPYQTARSEFPIYGNLVTFSVDEKGSLSAIPSIFAGPNNNSLAGMPFSCTGLESIIKHDVFENYYIINCARPGTTGLKQLQVPFRPTSGLIYLTILGDTLHKKVDNRGFPRTKNFINFYSRPTDSILKPMMHRSDNFFAEQSLLMVSNEMLGMMDDSKIIDTLLKTDFKDLPQKPRWADGSGLSRYNLFTPQDFVFILNKMKNEFGMERLKVILPTGGRGTISSYYKADSNYIFGKTGTLSGVVAFSGFLYTKKGKLLIFSTLVNNHQASATDVRKAIEKFLQGVRNQY